MRRGSPRLIPQLERGGEGGGEREGEGERKREREKQRGSPCLVLQLGTVCVSERERETWSGPPRLNPHVERERPRQRFLTECLQAVRLA